MNRNSFGSSAQYSLGTDSPKILSEPRRLKLDLAQLRRWRGFSGTSDCSIEEMASPLAQTSGVDSTLDFVGPWTGVLPVEPVEGDIIPVFGFNADTVSPIIHSFDFDEIDAIEAFCIEKGIAEWYSKIPGLLESHFPTLEGREFSLQEDDESEYVFVEVLFSVAGVSEEINDYYDIFLDTWVEEVPAEARAYFQLLLDIVE